MNLPGLSVELRWSEGEREVTWVYGGLTVTKIFDMPPTAVVAWQEPQCVVVVEPFGNGDKLDNAIVFRPDGSEQVKLIPPDIWPERSWRLGFYTVHPDGDALVAVFTTRVGDVWGRPNLETGELTDIHPWR